MKIYICYNVSEASKKSISGIAEILVSCLRTMEDMERKNRILENIFDKRSTTQLISSFYHAVFPMFKAFVLLDQKKEPQIHHHHIEQL